MAGWINVKEGLLQILEVSKGRINSRVSVGLPKAYIWKFIAPSLKIRFLIDCLLLSDFQVKALLAENINRPRKGTDAGDHPPITPMRSATEAELGKCLSLRFVYHLTQ